MEVIVDVNEQLILFQKKKKLNHGEVKYNVLISKYLHVINNQ